MSDLPVVVELFNGYLDFYEVPDDRSDVASFIRDRIERDESIILLARLGADAVGFVQVYPTFSSVARAPIWILNDLFVHPQHRKCGAGRALMRAVEERAISAGAARVLLSTDETNSQAQALYESEGYVTGHPVRHYVKRLPR
jgi:ribosomal protein S18 acetylase RimI-like enzyme